MSTHNEIGLSKETIAATHKMAVHLAAKERYERDHPGQKWRNLDDDEKKMWVKRLPITKEEARAASRIWLRRFKEQR